MTSIYLTHTSSSDRWLRLIGLIVCTLFLPHVCAQTINGDVYGGGKNGQVSGSTTVTVLDGTIIKNVYGGGMLATTSGNTTVEIAGGDLRGSVFGGARAANVEGYAHVYVRDSAVLDSVFGGNDIGGEILNTSNSTPAYYDTLKTKAAVTPKAFVHIAAGATKQPFIANLFGGGNGDYTYTTSNDSFAVTLGTTTFRVKTKPELSSTFIDISGGTMYNVFGGGNNATITSAADIWFHADTAKKPVTLAEAYKSSMPTFDTAAYTGTTDITFRRQIYRLFGGNNLVAMAIRPTWHLMSGTACNIYSGGNKGEMTCPKGILLTVTGDSMMIDNVFGGGRLADVRPKNGDEDVTTIEEETIDTYTFPAGYSARVRIRGGKIQNVFGGNDVAGKIYFGTNIVIESDILGDIYGAGNGAYAYTDKVTTSDYYYNAGGTSGKASIEKLNAYRPNAEKVLISLSGTQEDTTFICGAVYFGGSGATLSQMSGSSTSIGATLKMGSYVITNSVFLGSNGENMLLPALIDSMNSSTYNSADLTDKEQFDEYMKGVDVSVIPSVSFTDDYVSGSSMIGSFYCGGNVSSMTAEGTFEIAILNSLVLFDKFVAGCKNAYVAKTDNHAYYHGGLTSHADTKVNLNINGLKMEPRKLTYNKTTGKFSFDWNTYTEEGKPNTGFLCGGNIYGGCYNGGYVNGDVVINLHSDMVSQATYTKMTSDATHNWDKHAAEPSVSALSVYGGGYGTESEIWGDVTINISDSARALKVRGGGEKGWVGKMTRDADGQLESSTDTTYAVTNAYGTTVTMKAKTLTSNNAVIANIGNLCGGGLQGVVTGNTTVQLDSGCVYMVFGGAANADIYGGTEVIIGENGFPYVTRTVYGGNDFGGQIMGTMTHNDDSVGMIKSNSYVKYIRGEVGYNTGETNASLNQDASFGIFGAANGGYDYTATKYTGMFTTKPNMLSRVAKTDGIALAVNSFVHVPSSSVDNADKVYHIYAGGKGLSGQMGSADTYRTYVLLNAKNAADRDTLKYLVEEVYGGGKCSKTAHARMDAYRIYAKTLFGGCYGTNNKDQSLSYMGDSTMLNLYPSLNDKHLDIFGAGALSGAKETFVNVLGGTVHNIYGASYREGITYQANISVPSTSTATANALFGGGKGLTSADACDTYISLIQYDAPNAHLNDAVYGGNDSCRMTRNSFVNITVPVTNTSNKPVNVYGAGFGSNTFAHLTRVSLGNTAKLANVYGGGYRGAVYNVPAMATFLTTKDYYATDDDENTTYLTDCEVAGFKTWLAARSSRTITDTITYSSISAISLKVDTTDTRMNTTVLLSGGTTVNAFGGGYKGAVLGNTNTVVGRDSCGGIAISHSNGDPTVERSLYAGGEHGRVAGVANLTIYNGHIGYTYVSSTYKENNDYAQEGDSILFNNGNVFGGGYGDSAYVLDSRVTLYSGTIRNSLYGGGEVASIGYGNVKDVAGTKNKLWDSSKHYTAGQTHVTMYGGRVLRDVFGGGRGYAYDLSGQKTYANGYVFGSTEVLLHGGVIGTDDNVSLGYGNAFGGCNESFVYSVTGTKAGSTSGDKIKGYYYNGETLTEDTRVVLSPYCRVTAAGGVTVNGHNYAKCDYVPTSDLHYLTKTDALWSSLDTHTGVTVKNAVFAGGNAGSEYASTTGVYGNATATLNDIFHRDLITVGFDTLGGLYGDGNLTFVDGYRELAIVNYGEDSTAGRKLATLQRADFCGVHGSRIALQGARERVTNTSDTTHYAINRVGEVSLNRRRSVIAGETLHGNYLTMNDTVHFLRALSSDVQFDSVRYAKNSAIETDPNNSYIDKPATGAARSYQVFKQQHLRDMQRNKASSDNVVAIAQGGQLAIIDSLATGGETDLLNGHTYTAGEKVYGLLTGVIQLDLTNSTTQEDTGFVYARNIHKVATFDKDKNATLTLSEYNHGAITKNAYTYASAADSMQRLGNFVHPTKSIVDNCYPTSDATAPAHYWYFSSAPPTIGQLIAPSIVLPGNTVGLQAPAVEEGTDPITGSGWYLYTSKSDAESHVNGQAYTNLPSVYFYQDGYYVAYYAKTAADTTYSNAVTLRVANYHSIDSVLKDSAHHLYIDKADVKRNCKVYITSAASHLSGKNQIDLLPDLYTLCSTGISGHAPVGDHIKNCQNLDIVLSDDVTPQGSWTPVGSADACFAGDLHGDGHTIAGLDHSLFNYFCGNAYNIGLKGSFTGAGLADNGNGAVYNCWLMTSATAASDVYPFFGNGDGTVDNGYYNAAYKDPSSLNGWSAHQKDSTAFNNGEVAYNLNQYYLIKRYSDGIGNITSNGYSYYTIGANDTLVLHDKTNANDCGHYLNDDAHFSYTDSNSVTHRLGYVEYRYIHGDFLYAQGTIPTEENERLDKDCTYCPIYPDDYLFFGQQLSYNLSSVVHQETPSVPNRDDNGRLSLGSESNRVYRAPAYYGNSTKAVAYFNTAAVLPTSYTTSSSAVKRAYPGLTALDVSGVGDLGYARSQDSYFYPPLTDYAGITSFCNRGQSQNMLVYADPDDAFYHVFDTCLVEPALSTLTHTSHGSTIIDTLTNANRNLVKGHLVKRNQSLCEAERTQCLIDRQPFNAPIAYTFAEADQMWYQRRPDNYAGVNSGAEVISLPFEAQMVTTQTKGELTHFYEGSESGHEYWIREYSGIADEPIADTVTAAFCLPEAVAGNTKTDANTFLYDYYYSQSGAKDTNNDSYQVYYSASRTHASYPYSQPATPYLLGLPGSRYYEFDLSGTFVPKNTSSAIGQLDAQVLTWVSELGATIGVSDTEMGSAAVSAEGYIFHPYYGNDTIPVGSYILSASGNSFDITTRDTVMSAFRPYFTPIASNQPQRRIVFRTPSISKEVVTQQTGNFIISVSEHTITVHSNYDTDQPVTITTLSGQPWTNFIIAPGTDVTTMIPTTGVYIVAGVKVLIN